MHLSDVVTRIPMPIMELMHRLESIILFGIRSDVRRYHRDADDFLHGRTEESGFVFSLSSAGIGRAISQGSFLWYWKGYPEIR